MHSFLSSCVRLVLASGSCSCLCLQDTGVVISPLSADGCADVCGAWKLSPSMSPWVQQCSPAAQSPKPSQSLPQVFQEPEKHETWPFLCKHILSFSEPYFLLV